MCVPTLVYALSQWKYIAVRITYNTTGIILLQYYVILYYGGIYHFFEVGAYYNIVTFQKRFFFSS